MVTLTNNFATPFEEAFAHLLALEGGYANVKQDKGGETKFGISKKSYPMLDIENLTLEAAKEIYRVNWWDKYQFRLLPKGPIANKVFDLAVNMGPSQAFNLVQQAINDCGIPLVLDGMMGPATATALAACDPVEFMARLLCRAYNRYRRLAEKPDQARFLNGWINRLFKVGPQKSCNVKEAR